ncbi:MAG: permease-like cell division protein FtsX [Clostridiales bacterium]|nr:permease-like cell division protein FtsX [Clostridiales bacterium]
MKLNRFFFLIRSGVKSIFTHGFMSFASVTIIMACLIIMGSFSLVAVNINRVIDDLEDQNQVLAFVDETLTVRQAEALKSKIDAVENVRKSEFVTREQAMEQFRGDYDSELFQDIDATVFRHRFVIYLDDISQMEQTRDALEQISGIAKVNARLDYAEGFIAVRNVVSIISMVLIVILVVVSVFIMTNTIKLATFGRRGEIAIMKMVGAGNGFIRMPFVVEGVVLGLTGSLLAFFIEWALYGLMCQRLMTGLVSQLVAVIPFTALMWPVLLVFVIVGVLIGCFGGLIAIRNYLKV